MSGFLSLEDVLACKVTRVLLALPSCLSPFLFEFGYAVNWHHHSERIGARSCHNGASWMPTITLVRDITATTTLLVRMESHQVHDRPPPHQGRRTQRPEPESVRKTVLEITVTPNHAFLISINVTWQVLVWGFVFVFWTVPRLAGRSPTRE